MQNSDVKFSAFMYKDRCFIRIFLLSEEIVVSVSISLPPEANALMT